MLVLVGYFLVLFWIGWRSKAQDHEARDLLVGDRKIPWWAVLLSVLGTEISALTFVGLPASAYTGNWTYLQLTLGAIVGRSLVGRFFVPAFYKYNVVSIYELMLLRYGPNTRNVSVLIFLCTRLLMSGVRLYAGALVLQVAFGISATASVGVLAFIGFLFCVHGGIKAVVWTEVMQVTVMFLGALCTLLVLATSLPSGALSSLPAGSMQVFDLRLDPTLTYTLWAAVLGNSLTNAATFGTDYDMAQRMLTAKDATQSGKAVSRSGWAEIPIGCIFLMIGTLLRLYYQAHPDPNLPSQADRVFGYFIVTVLPAGLCGLLVAAVISVVLSTYQSALTALAGSFVVDLYKPYLRPGQEPTHYLAATRWATLLFALLLMLVALQSRDVDEILKVGLEVGTYAYGALLALFALAVWRSPESLAAPDRWSALVAVPLSIAAVVALKLFTKVAFPWFVATGCITGLVVIWVGIWFNRFRAPHPA